MLTTGLLLVGLNAEQILAGYTIVNEIKYSRVPSGNSPLYTTKLGQPVIRPDHAVGNNRHQDSEFKIHGGAYASADHLATSSEVFIGQTTPNLNLNATSYDVATWEDKVTFHLNGGFVLSDPSHSLARLWIRTTGEVSGYGTDPNSGSYAGANSTMQYVVRLGNTAPNVQRFEWTTTSAQPSYADHSKIVPGPKLALPPSSFAIATPWNIPPDSRLLVSLSTQSSAGTANAGATAESRTIFNHTMQILGFQPIDGNGMTLPPGSVSITSESGFQYPILYAPPPDVPIAGDYNGDGTVDAADYTAWRDSLGKDDGYRPADGDGDGVVDVDDFETWQNHFGNNSGSGAATQESPVPEPSTLALFAICCATIGCRRRR